MNNYCLYNVKTNSVLYRPKKGTGVSRTRRYRQDRFDHDKELEMVEGSYTKMNEELMWLQDYLGNCKEASQWEVAKIDDLPPF